MTRTRFVRVIFPALFLSVFAAAFGSVVAADDYAPMVTMTIQAPTGAAQTVEVRESLTGMIKVGNV